MRDEPGLPEPFHRDYLIRGARSWIVMFLWSLPVVATGVAVAILVFLAKRAAGFDYSGSFLEPIARDVGPELVAALESIGTGLQTITVLLLVVGPILQIAVVRTNLGGDWSGLRAREVFSTLRYSWKRAYAGALVWVLIGGVLHALGLLACGVGFYFGQSLWFALFGIFWADVYRVAVARGAPPVTIRGLAGVRVAPIFE